jgi:septal ring factor EnvC (AmiA/AmiB activator)
MWQSEHDSLRRQIKRLGSELKTLRKERQQVEATGCYSDRELAAKEATLEDYDHRIQILELERDRLQFMYQTGGSAAMMCKLSGK